MTITINKRVSIGNEINTDVSISSLSDKITNFDSSEKVGLRLDECRSEIRYTALNGTVVPRVLLNCEWLEAIEAYLRGNKAQAVEELYDTIAVCLRTIDVLEGRQKLGKPTENNKEDDK